MITFKKYLEIIKEDNIAGGGGVFGDGPSFGHGGAVGNSDFYASGDSRIPYVLGYFSRKGKLKSKKKKRKRIKKKRKQKK
jgi:hypothetical protein